MQTNKVQAADMRGIDIHEWMNKARRKIATLQKVQGDTIAVAGATLLQDDECARLLLSIPESDLETMISQLMCGEAKDQTIAAKLGVLLCYVHELRRLAQMDMRTLTGITRDDIARLQRLVVLNRASYRGKGQLVEKLIKMVGEFQEAEGNDRTLAESVMRLYASENN